jgi:hypothetical protein
VIFCNELRLSIVHLETKMKKSNYIQYFWAYESELSFQHVPIAICVPSVRWKEEDLWRRITDARKRDQLEKTVNAILDNQILEHVQWNVYVF